MGIQGLIPFLEKASRQVNIKEFAGCSVAVDAYCWLHKGAFSCADKLARGEPTNAYVLYCMKFVNMLLAANVTPIMVFDGRHLPAKASTEKKRRESREASRKRAAELLRAGKTEEARSFLRRCVDITHDMALALMRECRRAGVDCIVAPYEADAQLAYLNLRGTVQLVVTEDSDLVLFGCSRILFKMDLNGNGLLVERERLFLAMRVRPEAFSFDQFRHMCVLSGCDYLASLPGIGLSKARKFVTRTAETDMHKALVKLPSYLNMRQLAVTQQYRDDFVRAVETFRYQLVFDPASRRLAPLTEPPDSYRRHPSAGEPLPGDVALQLALGNLDPFTLRRVDHFDPDAATVAWGKRPRPSIWSRDYRPQAPVAARPDPAAVDRPTTRGKVVALRLRRRSEQDETRAESAVSDVDLTAMYGEGRAAETERRSPKRAQEEVGDEAPATPERAEPPCKQPRSSPRSPVLGGRACRNPFAVPGAPGPDVSPGLPVGSRFGALGKFSHAQSGVVVCSRYFVTEGESSSPCEVADRGETKMTEDPGARHQRGGTGCLRDVSNVIGRDGEADSPLLKPPSPAPSAEASENHPSPVEPSASLQLEPQLSPGKTHTSPSKPGTSFRWGELRSRFSFEGGRGLPSSPSVGRAFRVPRRDGGPSSSQGGLSQGSDDGLSGTSSSSADSGFATDSPASQEDRAADDVSRRGGKTEACRTPGLKKPAKQQSLLNLFGFRKKVSV
ncbi:exonuclease 1 [Bacillus rossius redtenbacheri]|uniref:exonuclease 1 n=1 Tax=Bacillus rossius redtenbacheri TaxID=93214 RepID=UPI002FDE9763